ncbi:MAG: CBS domain-containing protein [Pyrinomonadaceae bacterium]
MSENQAINPRQKCRDIMTKNPTVANREMTLQEVAALMRDGDFGVLPVVEKDSNKLVGILTDRDVVVRAVAEGKNITETTVGETMSEKLYTAKPDDFVFEAVRTMGERQVRRIPIVDNEGILQGIIAMADIALEMEDQREIAETLEDISSGAGFWKKN